MDSVYIIYSKRLDKYYVGESSDIDSRLLQHNNGFFKNSYTAQVNDWEAFLIIPCDSRSQSRKIELHIKKMKSRKYLENLKKYPEMVSKLLEKY
ncbi:GIY-YIG nuclease family protein [Flagellimonas crocea]|uniref:GIY-YIG nuclease family protein n=1 Tax=Flagellimonas crocea TaxID=3067311 RepID=UPI00296FC8B3|nr:GIY-YIG nuclease family protein [Muricauda sp. DH64]